MREAIIQITGQRADQLLAWEAGTHRVQRVPASEKRGRLHSSTATVSVLPIPSAAEVELHEQDLRLEVFRAGGHGGQGVNTTDSAVRVTHLPTGLVVTCQDERSQWRNRARALDVLRARLLRHQQHCQEQALNTVRRAQVGRAERSERIRTYNVPQDRVTDHRLGRSLSGLQRILDGELRPILLALLDASVACPACK